MDPKQCSCGCALYEWQSEATRIWAASLADVAAHKKGQNTRHDILNGRGRRIRIGQCDGKTPYGRPIL